MGNRNAAVEPYTLSGIRLDTISSDRRIVPEIDAANAAVEESAMNTLPEASTATPVGR